MCDHRNVEWHYIDKLSNDTVPNHTFIITNRFVVRFVASLGPRDHTSDAQRELHWLPIEQRITDKLCVLMHAVETGTTPEYISDMVKPVSVLEGRTHLRSATLGLYDIPRTRTHIGSKAFSVAGPTAWNSLPQSIRNIKSAFTFKHHLKTHLFKCAYI